MISPQATDSPGLSGIQFHMAMMDDFPAMVWGMQLDGTVCYFSRQALAFSGEETIAAASAVWYERVHPEDREQFFSALHAAFGRREPFSLQCRMLRHDGEYRWIVDRAAPMRNVRGEITGYLGVAHDVTALHTADALGEASARLVRILEATTDFVGMSSASGRPLFINAAGRKMLGLGPDQALHGHINELHPEWAQEILKEAIPAATRDGSWSGETAVLSTSGQEIPVSQVILAHHDAEGNIEFFSTIMRDLTERKREEMERIERANRYAAAIRASGQVLFDWNSRTHDITYGGDIAQLLGYTAAEMGGGLETLRKLVHPLDLETFDQELQRVQGTRDSFQLEFRARHKDESYRAIQAKGYFFLDREGHIARMVGYFADVSAQREAQQALKQAQEGLEARVAVRTAELARAYELNRDLARQQEAIAHLGRLALRGASLATLLDKAADLVRSTLDVDFCTVLQLSPDRTELIATAQTGWPNPTSGNRVPLGLHSQSGFTLMVREPVIVTDMAAETRFTPSDTAASHGVVSSVSVIIEAGESPLGVLCAFSKVLRTFGQEEVHFLQALANVLTEAIQRHRADEEIRVAHQVAETASQAKSKFLSRMSHELRTPLNAILGFSQLLEVDHPTPSQAESIGHIDRAGKHLLSLINGVLEIAEQTRRGDLVPTGPDAVPVRAPEPAAPQPVHTRTLLYIDDQDLNLRLVERIFQPDSRYRLLTAMRGREGLELARTQHPDLILLDLNLPDLSGEEVLANLKTHPATRHIPIVMVSADAMSGRAQELLEQGASGYVTKPYRVSDFLRVIEETLPHG